MLKEHLNYRETMLKSDMFHVEQQKRKILTEKTGYVEKLEEV